MSGVSCPHCGEGFIDGEQVCVLPVRVGEEFHQSHYHQACWFRSLAGSVAHVERRCSCYVDGGPQGDPEGMGKREAAEAALESAHKLRDPKEMSEAPYPACEARPSTYSRLWRIDPFLSPQPAGNQFPTLAQLQAYVGGYVQMVPSVCGGEAAYLFVDEDGKSKRDLKANVCATAVLYAKLRLDAGERSYSNYRVDNPFECLPDAFDDLVVGRALVWVGPLPPEELH